MPQKMFRLTDEQICKLKKVSELRGCSQTDLIRGFIDSLDEEPPDTQGDTHRDTQEIHGVERSSGADSPALAALVEQLAVKDAQLAKKDEQIAKLMDAVADSIREYVEEKLGTRPYNYDGYQNSQWIVLDYGNVYVHVFLPEFRERYRLEELWADAVVTEIEDIY